MAKIIFIIGGPGCGKGTQCEKIVNDFGFEHLSSGDLLRAEVASGSEAGKALQETMASGQLVSNETVLGLMKNKIESSPNAKGFLIDGYPRTVDQGLSFEEKVGAPTAVIYFEADEETLVARLLHRAQTSGRADDNEVTIRSRLAVFSEQTVPVINHYKSKNIVHQLNSLRSIDEIYLEVPNVGRFSSRWLWWPVPSSCRPTF